MKLWIGVGVALPPKAKKSRTLVWWTGVEVVYFKQLFCLQIVFAPPTPQNTLANHTNVKILTLYLVFKIVLKKA